MDDIVGLTVHALLLSPDNDILYFVTEVGTLAYQVDGDCCSSSWYNDILGVENLLHREVTGVLECPLDAIGPAGEAPEETADSLVQLYGVRLSTELGYTDIVFRNHSNGYYGGSMTPMRLLDEPPGGLRELWQDWSADGP